MNEHTSPSDRKLDELTAALPREVAPPPELWSAIRAELAERSSEARRWDRWRLAAAAVLIAASSSLVTMVALRGREHARVVATAPAAGSSSTVATKVDGELPARLVSAEQSYLRSTESLRRKLDERRDSLAPSTVATVERSLRIADSAIAEARAALERDPSNAVLAALFTSNYERKIDVLRRATELAPKT
ncbi:MAG: hypothetical protein JF589_04090 [Gemmatimonadetes bacterium]|nr:hypothetical protein [Gemmatimonadota bacterium]